MITERREKNVDDYKLVTRIVNSPVVVVVVVVFDDDGVGLMTIEGDAICGVRVCV